MDSSLRGLQTALGQLDQMIAEAVVRARAASSPTDALRGLVIRDEDVDDLLRQPPMDGGAGSAASALIVPAANTRFDTLAYLFDLTPLDQAVLLIALAAELDRRYERFFGYLQDDITQRRPTVNLAMNLLGGDLEGRYAVRERLSPAAPLRQFNLVVCVPDPQQREPVFLAYQLKADERIAAYVLGDDGLDTRVAPALTLEVPGMDAPLDADMPLVYLEGSADAGAVDTARAVAANSGFGLLRLDMAQLKALELPFELAWRLSLREAVLQRAGLLIEAWESCLNSEGQPNPALWSALLALPLPVCLNGRAAFEPRDAARERRLLRLKLETLPYTERRRCWNDLLAVYAITVPPEVLDELVGKFRLTASAIARSVQSALDYAATRGEGPTAADLYAGVRAQSEARLGSLAQRITPRYGWDDLVLPDDRLTMLRELCARARFAHIVRGDWGYGRKIAPSGGVNALFAGESGTGKTMAAEVIAADLGLVMYRIDLSAVVSKYIGETEKNLSAIFDGARASAALLFFDEADALFGKRSEVRDAHDRYANIEIAYLLQQIENYEGVAVLATNLRQNLDEAFTRRLDFLIDFPFPDRHHRQRIWALHFPTEAPVAADVNLDELAARYHLAGGNIRNAALASAYLAAADGGVITMAHVRHAVRREHQKMGRLLEEDLR
jgi:hypothetical protein